MLRCGDSEAMSEHYLIQKISTLTQIDGTLCSTVLLFDAFLAPL